jgi:hypothetical protein
LTCQDVVEFPALGEKGRRLLADGRRSGGVRESLGKSAVLGKNAGAVFSAFEGFLLG